MNNRYIIFWLIAVCFLVLCTMSIGAYTRLIDAGLSITDWKPVSGVIPPITEQAWLAEFENYMASPEYIHLNSQITISEFKEIFWVEFIHRISGRLTFFVYFIPLLMFVINNNKTVKNNIYTYYFVSFLFILQGIIGWYMVKSGLIDKPYVSHYRLGLHLLIALFIYIILFHRLLFVSNLKFHFDYKCHDQRKLVNKIFSYSCLGLALVIGQIFCGALVAGLDAGLVYNSFPYMGDGIVPYELSMSKYVGTQSDIIQSEFANIFSHKFSLFLNFNFSMINFNDPVFVQFFHRMLGYFVAIYIIFQSVIIFRINDKLFKLLGFCLFLSVFIQIFLGAMTVIYNVPIFYAMLHQLFAVFIVSLILYVLYMVKRYNKVIY